MSDDETEVVLGVTIQVSQLTFLSSIPLAVRVDLVSDTCLTLPFQ